MVFGSQSVGLLHDPPRRRNHRRLLLRRRRPHLGPTVASRWPPLPLSLRHPLPLPSPGTFLSLSLSSSSFEKHENNQSYSLSNTLQLALLSWCYFKAVFEDPGSVPENWRPAVTEEENLEAGGGSSSTVTSSDHVAPDALVSTWSSDGLERKPVGYCFHCQNGKPPRCHHCSICKSNLQMLLCFLTWS